MNLSILIFSGIVWSFAEFLLFNVFLPRTEKVFFQVMFFVAFLMGMFIGAWLIFNLGKKWSMESEAKIIIGVCSSFLLIIDLLKKH